MGVYKDKSGKWYCRGRIKGERYHCACTGATTQSKAKLIEDAIRYKIIQKQLGLVEKKVEIITLDKMMSDYVENAKINNKSDRIACIQQKYILEFFGGKTDVSKIKPSDIDRFKMHLIEIGRKNSTVNRYLSAIKRAYNIQIKNKTLMYNPTNDCRKLKEDNRRYRVLSVDEWKALETVLSDDLKDIVIFALKTGFRKTNVLQCKWEQINWEQNFIELCKQDNKGHKSLKISMTQELKLMLSRRAKISEYIFVNPKTLKPYTDIRKSFESACKKAGIEGFHFHDLRRTFATWLLNKHKDTRFIQETLGHSELSTTERYLAIPREQNLKALDCIDEIMSA